MSSATQREHASHPHTPADRMTPERDLIVLAAVDGGSTSRSVVTAAGDVSQMMGACVEVVLVAHGMDVALHGLEREAGIRLRELPGESITVLLEQAARPEVIAIVVGDNDARGGSLPAGHVAVALAAEAALPLIVVPSVLLRRHPIRTVLVPLDGTAEAAAAVAPAVDAAVAAGSRVVVLHVHEMTDLPLVTDQPQHEAEAWARSFLQRHCSRPRSVRLEVRTGRAAEQLSTVAGQVGADMILLAWSRRLDRGGAAVVHAALTATGIPVMLMPVAGSAPDRVIARSRVQSAA